MKTTLIIADPVMNMARQEAARLNVTISHLVEDALRLLLYPRPRKEKLEPLPTWNGGPFLVDVSNGAALRDLLSAEKDARLYGPDRDTRPWSEQEGLKQPDELDDDLDDDAEQPKKSGASATRTTEE